MNVVKAEVTINLNKHFRAFYLKNAADMIFFARKFVDYETAEDIVHDIFLKIWDSKSTIIVEEDMKNYLITMVRNACLDHLKSKSFADNNVDNTFYQINFDELRLYTTLHDNNLQNDKIIEDINEVIEKLPNRQRLVFEKAFLNEQKHSEIAEELNISIRTVETHIYKALKFLRENIIFLLFLF